MMILKYISQNLGHYIDFLSKKKKYKRRRMETYNPHESNKHLAQSISIQPNFLGHTRPQAQQVLDLRHTHVAEEAMKSP